MSFSLAGVRPASPLFEAQSQSQSSAFLMRGGG